jgi:hypothetical protein
MVHDQPDVIQAPGTLDQIAVRFDEQRLVSDAGLLLTGSLAERLGVEQLVNDSVWLDPKTAGAALPGRKVMSLVHGMLVGADSIDDMNVLRAGSTGLVLGHTVMAHPRWARSCARSRSGMSANSITSSTSRCGGRGRRAPGRQVSGW